MLTSASSAAEPQWLSHKSGKRHFGRFSVQVPGRNLHSCSRRKGVFCFVRRPPHPLPPLLAGLSAFFGPALPPTLSWSPPSRLSAPSPSPARRPGKTGSPPPCARSAGPPWVGERGASREDTAGAAVLVVIPAEDSSLGFSRPSAELRPAGIPGTPHLTPLLSPLPTTFLRRRRGLSRPLHRKNLSPYPLTSRTSLL